MTDSRPPLPDDAQARRSRDRRRRSPSRRRAPLAPRRTRGASLTPRNYVWIVGAAIVVFLGLRYLGPVLTPFLIGAILAYLGTPLVDWAARRRISRGASTTVVVLLFGFCCSRCSSC